MIFIPGKEVANVFQAILDYLNEARLDLIDPVNSRAEARYEKLLRKLHKLQINFEGNKLRYA